MIRRDFDVNVDIYSAQAKTYIAGTTQKQAPWFVVGDNIDSALIITIFKNGEKIDCTDYELTADFYSNENVSLKHIDGVVLDEFSYEIIIDSLVTATVQDIFCKISLYRDVDIDGNAQEITDSKISFPAFKVRIR